MIHECDFEIIPRKEFGVIEFDRVASFSIDT